MRKPAPLARIRQNLAPPARYPRKCSPSGRRHRSGPRRIGAKRVVEIGALRGETTVLMLEPLGPESELHVIDPVPAFDPSRARQALPRSLHLPPRPQPQRAARPAAGGRGPDRRRPQLVHGLPRAAHARATAARTPGAPLPLLILHDVGWPYGRRDLYYAPEQIPEEFRQPYDRRGMMPGQRELARRGRAQPAIWQRGRARAGPRNGVHDRARRLHRRARPAAAAGRAARLLRPGDRRRARSCSTRARSCAELLDRLESADGRCELLELAETIRARGDHRQQHRSVRTPERRADRAAGRYLDLLKGALLDEHYLENELRIGYLLRARRGRRGADAPTQLRDPARNLSRTVHQPRAGAPRRRARRRRPGSNGASA